MAALHKSVGRIPHAVVSRFITGGDPGNIVEKLAECIGGVAVGRIGVAHGCGQRPVRADVRPAVGGGHTGIHELHLLSAGIGEIRCQHNLKSPYRFEIKFEIEFVALCPECG